LAVEHFFRQIIHDVVVAAAESGDEAGRVLMPLHRERSLLKSGDPALGVLLQSRILASRPCRAA